MYSNKNNKPYSAPSSNIKFGSFVEKMKKHTGKVYDEMDLTSDHTLRTIGVRLFDSKGKQNDSIPDGGKVRIATWNLQEQCKFYSFGTKQFYNNPFNIVEDDIIYNQRKKLQLDKIKSVLSQTAKPEILLFQEADVFFKGKDFVQFGPELNKAGYRYITPSNLPEGKNCQKLVIAYDSSRFTLVDNSVKAILPVIENNIKGNITKYRGFACDFKDNKAGDIVHVANLHLKFDLDYSKTLKEYMDNHPNKLVIMGGDTNHISSDIKGMFGNKTIATNFTRAAEASDDLTKHHKTNNNIVLDKNGKYLNKNYDAFFVKPPKDKKAQLVEEVGEHFHVSQNNKLLINKFIPGNKAVKSNGKPYLDVKFTATGKQWLKGKDLASEIKNLLNQSKNAASGTQKSELTREAIKLFEDLTFIVNSKIDRINEKTNGSQKLLSRVEVAKKFNLDPGFIKKLEELDIMYPGKASKTQGYNENFVKYFLSSKSSFVNNNNYDGKAEKAEAPVKGYSNAQSNSNKPYSYKPVKDYSDINLDNFLSYLSKHPEYSSNYEEALKVFQAIGRIHSKHLVTVEDFEHNHSAIFYGLKYHAPADEIAGNIDVQSDFSN
ncbi:MAG: hypothetical protein K0Q51_1337 [Rickettsiaceae bacterium]|jgi:hypothetical protein|nr:hypothetical protein [Rickettsiaceae bacterium]